MVNFLISLITGAVAGWLASKIMNMNGGLLKNIILGIVGGAVGGCLLSIIGISGHGFVGNVIVAVIGACVLIWVARAITN